MSDAALAVKHYRYEPDDLPAGVYQTPLAGELCTGEVIEVLAERAQPFDADPAYKRASQKDYDKQAAHHELVAAFQKSHEAEEE